MTIVANHDHIIAREQLRKRPIEFGIINLLSVFRRQQMIYRKKFVVLLPQRIAFQVAQLNGRDEIFRSNYAAFHGRQLFTDKTPNILFRAHHRKKRDIAREVSQMFRNGKRAARVPFAEIKQRRHRRIFHRQALHFAENIIVNYHVADNEYLQIIEVVNLTVQLLKNIRAVFPAQILRFFDDAFGQCIEKSVQKFCRAVDRAFGEVCAPAVMFDDFLFGIYVARHVVLRNGIFRALNVDIGLNKLHNLVNSDCLAQHHIIDKFNARQKCHALMVVEIRSAGTFVDVLRRGHGNDENIALRLRLLQMFNVPVMQQIKDAVAKDDRFILGAKFLP